MLFLLKRLFYKYFLVLATKSDNNVYFDDVRLAAYTKY